MTQQEMIDRDIRMLVGDQTVQLIFARARIAELEAQLSDEHRRADSLMETLDKHQKGNGADRAAPA